MDSNMGRFGGSMWKGRPTGSGAVRRWTGRLILIMLVSGQVAGWAGAQQPTIVQPGAPGKGTRILPRSTRAKLAPLTAADIGFMQGMIVHHQQAVEMTALIEKRTTNREVRSLGARISHSQADEIAFMKRWLVSRGQPVADPAGDKHAHHHGTSPSAPGSALMPGMLSPAQMDELAQASGVEFDRLFLVGMIQHHGGALSMVRDLFAVGGAGQDAEIFNFATDVDSSQRAEIRIMQAMLEKITSGGK
ncbi:MAG: DUF305 domain-containing protein [Blastocatellia bacterium]